MSSNGMSLFARQAKWHPAGSPADLSRNIRLAWRSSVGIGASTSSSASAEACLAADTMTTVINDDEAGEDGGDEDNGMPPPKEDPLDDETDETDAAKLKSLFDIIKNYVQTEVRKVNQNNRRPLIKFQESVQECAYIRLKQTLLNTSREEDILTLTKMTQPISGHEVDKFAAWKWAQIVTESKAVTPDDKDEVYAHLMAGLYGDVFTEVKDKPMNEKVDHFVETAQTRNTYYICSDIKQEIAKGFNLIPQELAANLLDQAITVMDNVKQTLHGHILKYIHRDLEQLNPVKPILKDPRLLAQLENGGISIDEWVQYCQPHTHDGPHSQSG